MKIGLSANEIKKKLVDNGLTDEVLVRAIADLIQANNEAIQKDISKVAAKDSMNELRRLGVRP